MRFPGRRSAARAAATLAVAVGASALLSVAPLRAAAADVEGAAPSLRDVLQRLCSDAGITLRYQAAERPAPAIEIDPSQPEDALRRLLQHHNYVMQIRHDAETGASRVTAVHVLSASSGPGRPAVPASASVAAAQPAAPNLGELEALRKMGDRFRSGAMPHDEPPPPPDPAMEPSIGLLEPGLAVPPGASAAQLFADLQANPDRLAAFLDADTDTMARWLKRRYPEAPDLLRQIAERDDLEPAVRAKLERLRAALE